MTDILLSHFAAACGSGNFFNFPTWHQYLNGTVDANGACIPKITALSDMWLIVAAILEIMLRIAAIMAVGIIIYGGFLYITSQGEPDKTTRARMTLINAIAGLILAALSAVIVAFIAGGFK